VIVWLPIISGEVYNPLDEIVPTLVLPPAIPSTLQLTVWLLLPVIVALNCRVPLSGMEVVTGVISTAGSMTISVVVEVRRFVPHIAAIVVEPAPAPLANPLLAMEATPAIEVQVTDVVTFREEPSLYCKVAANCC
jgi:hypothetical protein